MNQKSTLLSYILHYKQILLLCTGILSMLGIIALWEMPRDEFPQFTIRQGLIIGIYPGASSEQVEEQVTKKVEQYLFQYESVDRAKTYSLSKENLMVIYVEIDPKEKDPKLFWAKMQHGLNEFKSQLPAGVVSLTADNDFGNTSAVLLAVQSDTKSYRELEKCLENFEDNIRKIPSASRIKHYGLQNEVINIYIDDAKLTKYGVKPLTVFATLKPEGLINYAGELDDGNIIRPIHIPFRYQTESDITNQMVYADPFGNVVRIKDLARVVREYPEPDSFIRLNGKKCLLVSLEMRPGNNIVQFGTKVDKVIADFSRSLPPDVKLEIISNMPQSVSKAIQNFMKEFWIAIIAVILVTIVLLPRKVALVATSTIPISIFITLGIMWSLGMDLQTVSLAALIIVLGMVVDNAIVIVDNYVEKLDHQMTPFDAASQSVTDLFGSVFSATLIIIICFAPMPLFMTGMGSNFISSAPITVAIALLISLAVSALLVPLMCYFFIHTGLNKKTGPKASFLNALQGFYNRALETSFKKKKAVVLLGVISFIAGLIFIKMIPQESFPKVERNQFAVEVYLTQGSSLQQTDQLIKDLEQKLAKDPRVKLVSSFVGSGSPRFHTLYAPNFPAKNYGQLIVLTQSNEDTIKILDEYSKKYSNCYPNAYVKWKQLEMSPSKAPIEIRISGDNITTLKKIAQKMIHVTQSIKGVTWVRTDYGEPLQAIRLNIQPDEANRLGYSKTFLAYSLMVGTKGFPVSTIWEDDYPVQVVLKVDKKTKTSQADIENLYVTSPLTMASVPLRQLTSLQPEWTEGEIVRRSGIRTITVRVDIERGQYTTPIFIKIKSLISKMKLPEGLSIEYGGEYEQNKEAMNPLGYSLAVSILLIFMILLCQFRNTKTALLIMSTMPLSVFGAALGLFITGYPFSLTAFVGIISLMGMVVRNGIIYVSYAEELRYEHGHSVEEAAISAAKRRMRPIFLTASAAAVGVIPMIISGSSLWGPLGAVMCFGLLFGLVLSLIVLPVLYYLFHRKDFNRIEGNMA